MQEHTISIILAGGIGSRLHPLTSQDVRHRVFGMVNTPVAFGVRAGVQLMYSSDPRLKLRFRIELTDTRYPYIVNG